MTDIVAFLTARLDEDQAAAEAAIPKEWKGRRDIYLVGGAHRDQMRKDWVNATLANGFSEYVSDEATTAQVARHDPARVLREVGAKRRILARHGAEQWPQGFPPSVYELPDEYVGPLIAYCDTCSTTSTEGLDNFYAPWPCDTVKDLAAPHADHADYEQSWSVK